jgi:hypothetical protein
VYDVVSGKDSFTEMTREIAEYVGCKFNDAGEFRTGMVEQPTWIKWSNLSSGRWLGAPMRYSWR